MTHQNKKLIVFDLDETLTPSKGLVDEEMAALLKELLQYKKVAVITGGRLMQIEKQLLSGLACTPKELENLFLFPTCAANFHRYEDGSWQEVYVHAFLPREKEKIFEAFSRALADASFVPSEKLYGELVQDRDTQITFSAFGQDAPLHVKEGWDPDHSKRQRIIDELVKHIPEFEIRAGGATSIDVTKKGIDKAYGIRQIEEHLDVSKDNMLFVGDRLSPGGNDYPVKETGVFCIQTTGPEETKKIIRRFL